MNFNNIVPFSSSEELGVLLEINKKLNYTQDDIKNMILNSIENLDKLDNYNLSIQLSILLILAKLLLVNNIENIKDIESVLDSYEDALNMIILETNNKK